jgi:hypothetical protein
VGKERNQLMRALAISLRELMQQAAPGAKTRDLAAFIVMLLENIAATIDRTVEPWEKRGYWVKADRFRLDWDWAERAARQMRAAVLAEDYGEIALVAVSIGEKLSSVKLPQKHRLGTPWDGAWEKLLEGE